MESDARSRRARVMMPGMPEARRAPKEAWELPLKLLLVDDLTGRADPRPIEDRRPIRIDRDSFPKVMSEHKLALSFRVEDTLAEGERRELDVSLKIRRLSDLAPGAIAAQVPSLKALGDRRDALTATQGPLGGEPAFRGAIQQILADPVRRARLAVEIGVAPGDPASVGGESLVDAILAATSTTPGDDGYEVGRRGVEALLGWLLAPGREGVVVGAPAVRAQIAEIDAELARQVDEILRHPPLQRIGSVWAGLEGIARGIASHAGVQLEILNASQEDLLADYEDSPEIRKSGLYKILYTGEYGGPGGRPYGAVLLGHAFGAGSADLALLRSILQSAAPAHAPVIVRPAADLAASEKLRALRATEEGRYLGFGAPESAAPILAESFAESGFGGGIDGIDPLLWVAARVAQCLKVRHRYAISILRDPAAMQAFHDAWLAGLSADPDDGVRPLRGARLRVIGDEGGSVPFELSLHAWGDGASPAGPVVIRGQLDKE